MLGRLYFAGPGPLSMQARRGFCSLSDEDCLLRTIFNAKIKYLRLQEVVWSQEAILRVAAMLFFRLLQ